RPVRSEPGNRLLWSLGDRLRGADGRLRRDVLAKPVDYSGRGVLVPDPDVPPGRCALPAALAAELFLPEGLGWLISHDERVSPGAGGPRAGQGARAPRGAPRRGGRPAPPSRAGGGRARGLLGAPAPRLPPILNELFAGRRVLLALPPVREPKRLQAFEPVVGQ